MPAGIPRWIGETTLKFRSSDLASVEALFNKYTDQIACVISEPARTAEPEPGFLTSLKPQWRAAGV
jgi:glutamate-1-semialdehyde 2,1-aminomutase